MHGTTFRTSRSELQRRRTDGPVFTLIRGTSGVPHNSIRDARPSHPAQDGFTPEGLPNDRRDSSVHNSEPGPSPSATSSRGSTTLDQAESTSTGSGPIDQRGQLLQLIAEFLEQHAGVASAAAQITEARAHLNRSN